MPPDCSEREVLSQAYQQLNSQLLSWLRSRVPGEEIAEDLLHDVFIKMIAKAQSSGLPDNVEAWLKTVMKTTLADFYRQQKPYHPLPPDLVDDESSAQTAAQALSQCLLPLVGQLPTICRDTLQATQLGGMTLAAYAAQNGLSESAVKSRVARGREHLKVDLLTCCEITLDPNKGVADYSRINSVQCC